MGGSIPQCTSLFAIGYASIMPRHDSPSRTIPFATRPGSLQASVDATCSHARVTYHGTPYRAGPENLVGLWSYRYRSGRSQPSIDGRGSSYASTTRNDSADSPGVD